jgi:3-deoxy-manno-octulosonate cytidylyltransferase (CMP-KDO synthetase)
MPRDRSQLEQLLGADPASFYQHVGIYGFRYEFLLKIPEMTSTQIEKIEMLEQLRFLDAGWPVFVGIIEGLLPGIDTPEDYALFVNRQVN